MLRTRKLAAAVWLLGVIALAAGAVPAFTADNGSITGTVSVPDAACIELSSTSLDYGTVPFAASGSASRGFSSAITFTNCSSAVSRFAMSGTDASGTGGSWSLTDDWLNCDGRLNRYGLFEVETDGFPGVYLTTAPKTLVHHRAPANTVEDTFGPGEADELAFILDMPCAGSAGAGRTFSFSVAMTATVA
jgi:hypothetical protein